MRLITGGPPKSGTTLLKRTIQAAGFNPLPGAIINSYWKRHADWVENKTRRHATKDQVKATIRQEPIDQAWQALLDAPDGSFLHGHLGPHELHDVPTVIILRDPRAAMVSFFRAKMQSKANVLIRTPSKRAIHRYVKWLDKRKSGGGRAMRYVKPIYERWRTEPPRDTLLIVHYETFFDDGLQLIADFTGTQPVPKDAVYGRGSKWSGLPSAIPDWYSHDEVRDAFDRCWNRTPNEIISKGEDRV